MWGEVEGSPVLAAPGSNDYSGLIASTTNAKSGSEACSFQGLSNEDANKLCVRYRPLALKTAGKYRDKGIDLDELRSAGLSGLVLASRRYDRRTRFIRYICQVLDNGRDHRSLQKEQD